MGQLDIFPNSTQFPVPLYPIISLLVSLVLYYALFKFNLRTIIENLLTLTTDFSYVPKTLIYLFLINLPLILLLTISLLNDNNQIGFQISCDLDQIQIIFISSYICFIEQSRQTPIRGFIFNRDLITLVSCLACLIKYYQDGVYQMEEGFAMLGVYIIYIFLQISQERLENASLKILGIKESNDYNSNFLLTQTKKQANYLQITDTIYKNKQIINNELNEFKQLISKLYKNQSQRTILNNFGKLFLPYKNAIEIEEQTEVEIHINKICRNWTDFPSNYKNDDEEISQNQSNDQGGSKLKGSATCLTYNRTLTDDFIIEDEEAKLYEDSTFNKAIKYCFYPLYFISTVQGRPRYFLDYLCMFILIVSMWLISTSCNYFIVHTNHTSYCFLSLIIAALLSVPPTQYYLRISAVNDFDFINIFLQSAILKSIIFGILITILSFMNKANSNGSEGLMLAGIINLVTYLLYGFYMFTQKYATRKTNMKYLAALSISSFIIRIVVELCYNVISNSNTTN